MAGESDGDSDASVKDGKLTGFKCCIKKNCSVSVCINCFSIYHNSCLKRLGSIKNKVDETKIECCSKSGNLAGTIKHNDEVCEVEKEKTNMEIRYLKKLLEELTEKNNILMQNNQLLTEKISVLEKEKNINKNAQHSQIQNKNVTYRDVASVSREKTSILFDTNKVSVKNQAGNIGLRDQGHGSSNAPQFEVDSSAADGGEDGYTINNNDLLRKENDNDGFQFQRRRKFGNQKKKSLGTGNTEPNFKGGDRRAWLYVNRVQRSASEESIINYLRKKPGFESIPIIVKEIPTDVDRLKSFLVITSLDKKEELYDCSFWPKYVGVGRFKFEKHKELLKNIGDVFNQNRGGNFLE